MTFSTVKLNDVCNILIGRTPPRGNSQYWHGGRLPWVSVADLTKQGEVVHHTKESITDLAAEEQKMKLLPVGTLLMSFKLSIGKVAFAGTDLYTNEAIVGLIVKNVKELDKKYLYYFLKQASFDSSHKAVKGNTLNKEKIKNIEIPLPPLETQKKIVAKVEALMEKINEAKKLRAEAQSAADNLLSAELHKIFEEGKEKGWEEKELGEVIKVRRETKKRPAKMYYVGMENIEFGVQEYTDFMQEMDVRSATYYFDENAVLYGRLRPYLNKVLLPDFEGHCSTELFPLYPDQNYLSRKWLWYWLNFPKTIESIVATSKGTRMPRADMNQVMKFKIPLPPLPEQKKIVARLDSLSEKIRQIQTLQSETASDFNELERSILHKAFSGELI